MTRSAATLIGFTAVLMWAVLALMSAASGDVPPFQLAAMTFFIGGMIGVVTWPFRPGAAAALRQNWRVWLLGVGGLFGYHFVYFSAIRAAPPVEVSLIAYLWPLFLVLFSAMLPGERLKSHHLLGVVFGLGGCCAGDYQGPKFRTCKNGVHQRPCAGVCLRPSSGLGIRYCRGASVKFQPMSWPASAWRRRCLPALSHLAFEQTVWPQGV